MPVTIFDDLLAEAEAQPTEGWDFSWFNGRATEERPSWGYARLISEQMAIASSVLDIQTGGGEVLAGIQSPPPRLAATESWLPNVDVARRNLKALGASVVAVGDDALPFSSNCFDLVVSRHPVITPWEEIARVLVPGGTFLSQQVGAGTNRELTDFFMGPQPIGKARNPERHVTRAGAVGLRVDDLRDETLLVEFFDVGAVAYFLRKVLWTVPGFTIDAYRDRLQSMHMQIGRDGRFISHSRRFLIRATRTA
jgi:SAM-dependent methyltransferase